MQHDLDGSRHALLLLWRLKKNQWIDWVPAWPCEMWCVLASHTCTMCYCSRLHFCTCVYLHALLAMYMTYTTIRRFRRVYLPVHCTKLLSYIQLTPKRICSITPRSQLQNPESHNRSIIYDKSYHNHFPQQYTGSTFILAGINPLSRIRGSITQWSAIQSPAVCS